MVNEFFAISKTVADPFSAIVLKVVELVPLETLSNDRLNNARLRIFVFSVPYDSGTQDRVAVIDTSERFGEAIERIRRGFIDAEDEVEVRYAGSFRRTIE